MHNVTVIVKGFVCILQAPNSNRPTAIDQGWIQISNSVSLTFRISCQGFEVSNMDSRSSVHLP